MNPISNPLSKQKGPTAKQPNPGHGIHVKHIGNEEGERADQDNRIPPG